MMDAPAQILNRRSWYERWVTRTITGMMIRSVERRLARVERHLVQAEWELVSLGFLHHGTDEKQVDLRRSIRAAQKWFLEYKRAVNLMTEEDYQEQALGLREEA